MLSKLHREFVDAATDHAVATHDDGAQRQTIRIDDPLRPGPAVLVFEKENGETSTLDATMDQVRTLARGELSEQDAQLDGFDSLDALHAALDQHDPGLAADDR